MYSNIIKLEEFFLNLSEVTQYCVLKMPKHFPNYCQFSDLDILCENIEMAETYTVDFLKYYSNISVKVHYPKNGACTQVDVYPLGKTLDFKFDLIDSFSIYKKNKVLPELKDSILSDLRIEHNVNIPSVRHEMVVRMLEYLEYKNIRTDKVKHLRYVKENLAHINDFWHLWDKFVKEPRWKKIMGYHSKAVIKKCVE